MKIYFDGDSWTWGGELEDNKTERFSAIISKELGAEEYNYAKPKCSNDSIIRRLLLDNNISDYDFAIIQMTYPSRTEFYDGKYIRVATQDVKMKHKRKSIRNKDDLIFWTHYYKNVYNERYFTDKEKIHHKIICDHCQLHNVPLILTTINNWDTNLKFDLELEHTKYPRAPENHPNAEGHRIIAKDILSLLTTYK